MRMSNTIKIVLACLGGLLITGNAAAADDKWEFEVTPYFLAASLDGTVGVKGVKTDIDASFSDIWDHLDAGFMALFTARRGPLRFGFETVYFKLSDDSSRYVSGPFGKVRASGAMDVESEMYIYQATAGYRVYDKGTKVNMLGAVRYTDLEADLDIKRAGLGIVFPDGSLSKSGDKGWADLVVGASVQHPVSNGVDLVGYADVGGGGSDLTYQFILGADWEFKKDYIARAGYRQIYWDYEDGGFTWDMTASGAYLGLGIRF